MLKSSCSFLISFLLVSVVCLSLAYAEGVKNKRWWEHKEEGWFFYKDKPAPTKEKKEEEIQPPPKQEVKVEPVKPFIERMKEKEQELLGKALQSPTYENVREYMIFNKKRLEMSENFALMWQKVLMQHPELNTRDYYSTQDKDLVFERERKTRQKTLERLAQNAALFFFYTSDCEFCKRQAQYLDKFKVRHPNFIIKAISVDGGILPEFPDSEIDNGISLTLGVNTYPTIFLAFPPDRFDRIATGIIAIDILEQTLMWYDSQLKDVNLTYWDKEGGAN